MKLAYRITRSRSTHARRLAFAAKFVVAAAAVLFCFATPSHAQSLCPLTNSQTICLDQLGSGTTTVSGQATVRWVDVKVNETLYPKIRVISHKFSVTVSPLGSGLEVRATKAGTKFDGAGLLVDGGGLCQKNTIAPCIGKLTIGDTKVTVMTAKTGALTNATLGFNRNSTGGTAIQICNGSIPPAAGTNDKATPLNCQNSVVVAENTTVEIAVRPLTEYDRIDLRDANGNSLSGQLQPHAKMDEPCSSEEGQTQTCLNPVKTTDKAVTGFGMKSSSIKIELDKAVKGTVETDATTGAFTLDLSSLTKGQTITATQVKPAPLTGVKPATTTVKDVPAADSTFALYTLGLVGVNVAGASNTGPSQQYFVSFDTRLPIPFLGRSFCGESDEGFKMDYKCWLWFNPRIASAPAPASSTLKSFSSVNSLSSGLSGETLGQITQTIEVHSGAEYALFHGPRVPTSTTVAFKGGLSAIIGGGIVTPINPTSNASIFVLNNNLGNQFTTNALSGGPQTFAQTYPILASALCGTGTGRYGFTSTPPCTPSANTYSNVAFVLPNRSRFYRDYFIGLRLRTYFFSGDCTHKIDKAAENATTSCKAANIYPGTFDVRLGQDETVTGGYLRSAILTTSASYPLPGTSGAVRIFGSTYISMNRNRNSPALALLAASSTIPITDPTVVVQPIRPSDHDYFRLGLGVDLVPLISKWVSPPKTTTGSSTTAAAPPAATP
ncbi:MAG TPA: hypothetical protein VGD60_05055 [Candidatus Acidoferrales bacterium]